MRTRRVKAKLAGGLVSMACACMVAAVASDALAAWAPERNVEVVVGTKPGGGNDTLGRAVQRLFASKKLLPVSTSVINKPGGGGAVSLAYIDQQPGNGHYLAISSTTLLTNSALRKGAIRYTDVTPVAQLLSEYIAFSVRADSPIRSGKDLVARLRKDPEGTAIGFASNAGNAFHIALALAAHSAGIDVRKLKTVVFGSGGELNTVLLGGHADAIVTTPASLVPYLASGQFRVLAITAPNRLGGMLSHIPTWREQGVNAVFANWRGVVAPRGLTPVRVAYWDGVFARLTALEEWKASLDRNYWMDEYMNSADMAKNLEAQYAQVVDVLGRLGLIKDGDTHADK